MKKSMLITLTLMVAITVVPFVVYGGNTLASSEAPKEILFGGTSCQTGLFAPLGQGGTFGAKAAVEDINKEGGIFLSKFNTKVPVKLTLLDDQSNEHNAANLTEDLVLRSHVQFLLSPNGIPQTVATKALVAEKYKIPHVSAVVPMEPMLAMRATAETPWQYTWLDSFAIATPITDKSDFRYGKGGYTIIDTWGDMLEKFGDKTNKTFGFFASDDPDGVAWYEGFPAAVKAKYPEYKIIGVENHLGLFPVGTTDFSATIKKWKSAGVEILWGNSNGPDFGVMRRQMETMQFKPKMIGAARAALMYDDVASWGGNLGYGVGIEIWGHPEMLGAKGWGDTSPKSLADRWTATTGQKFNQMVPHGYLTVQIMAKAIEQAGTTETKAVQAALKSLDFTSIYGRIKFDENNVSRIPIVFGQWMKDDKGDWTLKIVLSKHDFLPIEAEPIFPIPYGQGK